MIIDIEKEYDAFITHIPLILVSEKIEQLKKPELISN